jgi:hypothetical protein
MQQEKRKWNKKMKAELLTTANEEQVQLVVK